MRGWKDLGLVDTIYEEEYELSSSSSPSLSPSMSSPPLHTPLNSRVESWSLATGRKTDVLIYVQGTCFHLHKDPLISKSSYLKRQLTELSEITLPLNITSETFALVADFCYGANVVLTPFNVVALRTAAELLGMTKVKTKRDENLKQITETYFRRLIATNRELTLIVFRSCLRFLPEAETAAFLLSRCIEALDLTGEGDEMDRVLDDIIGLRADEFEIVAEAMQSRFTSHNFLYRIIDLYFQQHNGKMTEEQKTYICNFIDCDKLSPQFLIQAVQNPILPLRFVVRAMLIEQLNTRRAIFTTSAAASTNQQYTRQHHNQEVAITLGSILQRDAMAREAAQLKAEMNSTSSRIESLEKELAVMKKLLQRSEKERNTLVMEKKTLQQLEKEGRNIMESSRSASFHYGLRDSNKIDRGERGSSSFAGFRLGVRGEKNGGSSLSNLDHEESASNYKKNIGMGFINRLKSTLWVSKSASSKCHRNSKFSSSNEDASELEDENEDVIVAKEG